MTSSLDIDPEILAHRHSHHSSHAIALLVDDHDFTQIVDGHWDKSVVTLHNIDLAYAYTVRSTSFFILAQQFFELLDEGKIMDALKTLRTELAPLCVNSSRLRELFSYSVSDKNGFTKQDIVKVRSRSKLLEELQKLLTPTVLILERRLEHQVELILQREAYLIRT
ncbi:hypothetical protein K1719_008761 [Acacia pycnantha]|nr:hypothetical protein K1719_008761 [Acacia pycnantha]